MKKKSSFGCELGRSMIEMLGVLAIVGVLSVGGISGFQKAMNKHKINQVTEELSEFLNELLRYSADWRKLVPSSGMIYITSALDFLLPANWRRQGDFIYDTMQNKFRVDVRRGEEGHIAMLVLSYRFQTRDEKARIDTCMALYEMAKSYTESVLYVNIWTHSGGGSDVWLKAYGNGYCSRGRTCLKDLTLAEMRTNCSAYKDDDEQNSFAFVFLL